MHIGAAVSEIHAWAHDKGFYQEPCKIDRRCEHVSGSRAAQLMLVVTELAEAVEADRAGDEVNYREEITDAVIRLFDLCGADKFNLEIEMAAKMEANKRRPRRHGKRY